MPSARRFLQMQSGVLDPLLNVVRVLGQVALELDPLGLEAVLQSRDLTQGAFQLVSTILLFMRDGAIVWQVDCWSNAASVDESKVSERFAAVTRGAQQDAPKVSGC